MENNSKVIPVFFAVDDGYIPFLAVALQSLIENSSKEYYYAIKILYTNISDENKDKLIKYWRITRKTIYKRLLYKNYIL